MASFFFLAIANKVSAARNPIDDLLEAMIQVESHGQNSAFNPDENAVGCLQIRRAYWSDARMHFGSHKSGPKGQDCWDRNYSKLVVLKYWERYCPNDLRNRNLRMLAFCHNGGGPKLYQKRPADVQARLDLYWEKVQIELRKNNVSGF